AEREFFVEGRGPSSAQRLGINQRTHQEKPMSLSFKKETVYVLSSTELDFVAGGLAAKPTATAVSSAKPNHGDVAKPASTAVSSAKPNHGGVAKPTSTAVSSAKPHGGSLSSVMPHGGSLSSAMPRW